MMPSALLTSIVPALFSDVTDSDSSSSSSGMDDGGSGVVLSRALTILAQVIGWVYFALWAFALYPQIYLNWKRKSVEGLSFDYLAFNLSGYVAYSVYNCCFLWSDEIHREYFRLHGASTQVPVAINDAVFALHGFFFTFVNIVQIFVYGRQGRGLACATVVGLCVGWGSVVVVAAVAAFGKLMWIYVLYYLSLGKLLITVIKYSPQVYLNWRNKNTRGWSIVQVFPDLGGAVFSLIQMMIVSVNTRDWNTCFGNPTKLFLAVLTIVYDSIFIAQHFVIYRENNKRLEREAQYEPIVNDKGGEGEGEGESEEDGSINNYDAWNTSINETE